MAVVVVVDEVVLQRIAFAAPSLMPREGDKQHYCSVAQGHCTVTHPMMNKSTGRKYLPVTLMPFNHHSFGCHLCEARVEVAVAVVAVVAAVAVAAAVAVVVVAAGVVVVVVVVVEV